MWATLCWVLSTVSTEAFSLVQVSRWCLARRSFDCASTAATERNHGNLLKWCKLLAQHTWTFTEPSRICGFQAFPPSCLLLSDSLWTETHNPARQTFNANFRHAGGSCQSWHGVCLRLLSSAKVTATLAPASAAAAGTPRHNRWQADNQQKSLSSILKSPVNQSASFSTWLSCLLTDGTERPKKYNARNSVQR